MAAGKCLDCGTAFGKGARFCKKCGHPLEKATKDAASEAVLTDSTLEDLERAHMGRTHVPSESSAEAPELAASAPEHGLLPLFPESVASSFTIEILKGVGVGRILCLNPTVPLVIGSDPDAHLLLKDESVSRRHATLHVQDGRLILSDENSSNGTFICVRSPREVFPGDCLVMGDTWLRVGRKV